VLKILVNSALGVGAVVWGCALAGCTGRAGSAKAPMTPAVEAIGRPALAGGKATSMPSEQTTFAKMADEACGLSGGCLVGASRAMVEGHRLDLARKANIQSEQHSAVPADALKAPTADINGDGFVTLDELIAMRRAGLSDQEMIDRLRATGQVFTLSPLQWRYLYDRGIGSAALEWMCKTGGMAER